LCCIKGTFLAIEAKAGKGETTALQKKNIREIEDSGGDAWVVRETNLENFKEYIKESMT
jgi:hypothetical protein